MKKFLHGKNLKFLVVTLVILAVMSVFSRTGVLSGVVNTITEGLSSVAAAADTDSKTKEELESENAELKQENAELREQLADYLDTKEENEKLWSYYGLKKENPSYEILPSNVVRRDLNDDYGSFTLDKGAADSVETNDPVITENGLVGWVSEVELTTCRVKTVLSPDTKAAAVDKSTGDSGILSGSASCAENNLTCLTKIAEDNKIETGDIVVTSGTGGIYPKNLIIGKVKEIKFNSYDASRYAVVEPYEDIENITSAAIITDFDGKGEVE